MASYASISRENAKRNAALEDMDCDPMSGRGGVGERFELALGRDRIIYMPESARGEDVVGAIRKHGSLKKAASVNRVEEWLVARDLTNVRFAHDFEFWAAACVTIQDKQTKQMIAFR
ncbi:MAG: hypothetical protein WD035_01830, partial [Balneolaceae bacterium]